MMSDRKHTFEVGEYYHVYNRGVDKKEIVCDEKDLSRFIQSIIEFNSEKNIGSIFENTFRKNSKTLLGSKAPKLVSIVAYCVNPNHFHLILSPLVEGGIEKFMQKIGGYPKYFNEKYKRSGALFQGKFKSKHVSDNTYLLHLSTYVNMNNRDKYGKQAFEFSMSSLEEYTQKIGGICDTSIVLEQFSGNNAYKKFAIESWEDTLARKEYLEI